MQKRIKSIAILAIIALTLVMALTACGSKVVKEDNNTGAPVAGDQNNVDEATQSGDQVNETATEEDNDADEVSVTTSENSTGELNPLVTIKMENGGKVYIELYPDIAPNTVNNFISLINKGFYDGVIFHRVIPGFMIQGGDPMGMGIGGPGYMIKGEFTNNGFENNLLHERGVISMARTNIPDSAGSQFFIMVEDSPFLDGEYAAFGRVLSGMETVDSIVNSDRNQADKPLQDQVMKKVSVDTFGVEYPDPEVIAK